LEFKTNLPTFVLQFENGQAKVAQLVERNLAKVEVAGSRPVFRSFFCLFLILAGMAELVDAQDLKSCERKSSCGFDSHFWYNILNLSSLEFYFKVVYFLDLIIFN
jgi:hypothetical protein